VPDIHGTYSIYKDVESYIKKNLKDDQILLFLGDYVNRGESGKIDGKSFKDVGSYYVLRDLMELKRWCERERREVIFLRGNHEILLEDYYIRGNKEPYKEYSFVRDSIECFDYIFERDENFFNEFKAFMENLHPYHLDSEGNYLFVHAGLDPKIKELQGQISSQAIYWIREEFLLSKKEFKNTIIFGHTPFSAPYIKKDRIGLDSGVYKRDFINLLQIDFDGSKIVQIFKQPNKKSNNLS
jgi:serine/threonine protein phosphatase 1